MRILHTESSTGWGGQENRTMNELVTMRDRGHELAVLSRPGARIIERANELGFPTFAVDMRGAIDFPNVLRLRSAMKRFGADIVNTHSGRDTQLAGMAARTLFNRPRIVRTRHLALPIYLKAKGVRVIHILSSASTKEHPYTSAANVRGDTVSYT